MLVDLWFVAEAGGWTGPFTAAEVQARLNDHRFGEALVWKPGLSEWQSIRVHFAAEASSPTFESAEAELTPALRSAGRRTAFAVALLALGVFTLSFFVFGEGTNYHRFGEAAAFVYATVWIAGVLMVLAIAVLAWRRAAVSGESWWWQMAKAVSGIAVVGALAFSIVFARVTTTIYNTTEARQSFSDYRLDYDPVARAISFEGPIGPEFANRLGRLLSANADVRVLYIVNSPGGLIDEALAAADTIEQHPDLAVEVSTECNSACFALFVAGRHRRAEYNAEFGFHRSAFITDMPAFAQNAASEGARDFREYVIGHGLRADLYDNWASAEQLHAVSAIELSEIGVLGELVSDGVVIDASSAKWRWISSVSAAGDNGVAELAQALAESGEPSLLQASGPIFAAARTGDIDTMRAGMMALLPELLPKVLESGEPTLVSSYLQASRNSLGYLVSMEQWDACASIVDGHGAPEDAIPNTLVRAELVALADAVRSAAAVRWVARPLPSWAQSAGRQAVDTTIASAASDGVDNAHYNDDARVRCLLTHRLLGTVQSGDDPVRSIVAYRWIASQG